MKKAPSGEFVSLVAPQTLAVLGGKSEVKRDPEKYKFGETQIVSNKICFASMKKRPKKF